MAQTQVVSSQEYGVIGVVLRPFIGEAKVAMVY